MTKNQFKSDLFPVMKKNFPLLGSGYASFSAAIDDITNLVESNGMKFDAEPKAAAVVEEEKEPEIITQTGAAENDTDENEDDENLQDENVSPAADAGADSAAGSDAEDSDESDPSEDESGDK